MDMLKMKLKKMAKLTLQESSLPSDSTLGRPHLPTDKLEMQPQKRQGAILRCS